jgi:hypothetical protein
MVYYYVKYLFPGKICTPENYSTGLAQYTCIENYKTVFEIVFVISSTLSLATRLTSAACKMVIMSWYP